MLVSQVGKADLRVPVYGAAKPVSTTTAKDGKVGRNPAIMLNGKRCGSGQRKHGLHLAGVGAAARRQEAELPACSDR